MIIRRVVNDYILAENSYRIAFKSLIYTEQNIYFMVGHQTKCTALATTKNTIATTKLCPGNHHKHQSFFEEMSKYFSSPDFVLSFAFPVVTNKYEASFKTKP